jgi:hypothetical protein
MALAPLLPLAAFVPVGAYTHEQAFRDAALRADRVTRIAQEHAAKVFDTNEAIVRTCAEAGWPAPTPATTRPERRAGAHPRYSVANAASNASTSSANRST